MSPSILSNKAEQTDKSTTLLGSNKRGEEQGKPMPPRLGRQTANYRESWVIRAETHKWKPLWQTAPR